MSITNVNFYSIRKIVDLLGKNQNKNHCLILYNRDKKLLWHTKTAKISRIDNTKTEQDNFKVIFDDFNAIVTLYNNFNPNNIIIVDNFDERLINIEEIKKLDQGNFTVVFKIEDSDIVFKFEVEKTDNKYNIELFPDPIITSMDEFNLTTQIKGNDKTNSLLINDYYFLLCNENTNILDESILNVYIDDIEEDKPQKKEEFKSTKSSGMQKIVKSSKKLQDLTSRKKLPSVSDFFIKKLPKEKVGNVYILISKEGKEIFSQKVTNFFDGQKFKAKFNYESKIMNYLLKFLIPLTRSKLILDKDGDPISEKKFEELSKGQYSFKFASDVRKKNNIKALETSEFDIYINKTVEISIPYAIFFQSFSYNPSIVNFKIVKEKDYDNHLDLILKTPNPNFKILKNKKKKTEKKASKEEEEDDFYLEMDPDVIEANRLKRIEESRRIKKPEYEDEEPLEEDESKEEENELKEDLDEEEPSKEEENELKEDLDEEESEEEKPKKKSKKSSKKKKESKKSSKKSKESSKKSKESSIKKRMKTIERKKQRYENIYESLRHTASYYYHLLTKQGKINNVSKPDDEDVKLFSNKSDIIGVSEYKGKQTFLVKGFITDNIKNLPHLQPITEIFTSEAKKFKQDKKALVTKTGIKALNSQGAKKIGKHIEFSDSQLEFIEFYSYLVFMDMAMNSGKDKYKYDIKEFDSIDLQKIGSGKKSISMNDICVNWECKVGKHTYIMNNFFDNTKLFDESRNYAVYVGLFNDDKGSKQNYTYARSPSTWIGIVDQFFENFFTSPKQTKVPVIKKEKLKYSTMKVKRNGIEQDWNPEFGGEVINREKFIEQTTKFLKGAQVFSAKFRIWLKYLILINFFGFKDVENPDKQISGYADLVRREILNSIHTNIYSKVYNHFRNLVGKKTGIRTRTVQVTNDKGEKKEKQIHVNEKKSINSYLNNIGSFTITRMIQYMISVLTKSAVSESESKKFDNGMTLTKAKAYLDFENDVLKINALHALSDIVYNDVFDNFNTIFKKLSDWDRVTMNIIETNISNRIKKVINIGNYSNVKFSYGDVSSKTKNSFNFNVKTLRTTFKAVVDSSEIVEKDNEFIVTFKQTIGKESLFKTSKKLSKDQWEKSFDKVIKVIFNTYELILKSLAKIGNFKESQLNKYLKDNNYFDNYWNNYFSTTTQYTKPLLMPPLKSKYIKYGIPKKNDLTMRFKLMETYFENNKSHFDDSMFDVGKIREDAQKRLVDKNGNLKSDIKGKTNVQVWLYALSKNVAKSNQKVPEVQDDSKPKRQPPKRK